MKELPLKPEGIFNHSNPFLYGNYVRDKKYYYGTYYDHIKQVMAVDGGLILLKSLQPELQYLYWTDCRLFYKVSDSAVKSYREEYGL